jgi:hypothetical protein
MADMKDDSDMDAVSVACNLDMEPVLAFLAWVSSGDRRLPGQRQGMVPMTAARSRRFWGLAAVYPGAAWLTGDALQNLRIAANRGRGDLAVPVYGLLFDDVVE